MAFDAATRVSLCVAAEDQFRFCSPLPSSTELICTTAIEQMGKRVPQDGPVHSACSRTVPFGGKQHYGR